jgi:uncharacterized protein YuzE
MRITYDPEGNVLYIELRAAEPANSMDLDDGVTADLDIDGRIIGIEFLDARERIGEQSLTSISFERLIPTEQVQATEAAT